MGNRKGCAQPRRVLREAQTYGRCRVNMIDVEAQYFSSIKNLLLAMGLWPYRQTRLVHLQYAFLLTIVLTALVFQV